MTRLFHNIKKQQLKTRGTLFNKSPIMSIVLGEATDLYSVNGIRTGTASPGHDINFLTRQSL